jgi:hypothetical protein
MRIPVSPFFTNRPNDFQVLNPATRVASGACVQMRRQLPKDYVHGRTMLSWAVSNGRKPYRHRADAFIRLT